MSHLHLCRARLSESSAGPVWILTLVISTGKSAMSTKNSADADRASQLTPLYLVYASGLSQIVLENLIEAVHEEALERVADEGFLGDDSPHTRPIECSTRKYSLFEYFQFLVCLRHDVFRVLGLCNESMNVLHS